VAIRLARRAVGAVLELANLRHSASIPEIGTATVLASSLLEETVTSSRSSKSICSAFEAGIVQNPSSPPGIAANIDLSFLSARIAAWPWPRR
jgi:hypothetical protein